MKKWYEQNFVSRRDWVLDNLELLGLSPSETIVVLLIDFMNEHHMRISIDALHKKTGLSNEEINQTVSMLCAKKYLEIRASSKSVNFRLDGLFETDTARQQRVLESSLFDLFESEFGRSLSQKEMQKISDWNQTMDKKFIIYALREASAYRKLSLPYIESILASWKEKGVTVEMLEEGKEGSAGKGKD